MSYIELGLKGAAVALAALALMWAYMKLYVRR